VKETAAQRQAFTVTLPGRLYQRGNRWWWQVKLPGDDRTRARPLGDGVAADDLEGARSAALELWERALTQAAAARARSEADQTIAKLKAQFLQKVRDFSQVVETTRARLEAETQARAEAESRLRTLARPPTETVVCEGCGARGILKDTARRIDSGQWLCPDCLEALRADAARVPS